MSKRVYAWGSGGSGQLGLGNEYDFSIPQLMEYEILQLVPESIVTGGCHSAAIDINGKLYVWGDNEHQQLGLLPPISTTLTTTHSPQMVQTLKDHKTFKVWCGWWHTTVAVSNEQDEDSVYSWGCPDHQQLGRNTSDAPHSLPSTVPFPVRIQVRSIACGWKHSLLATIDGQVYAWGKGRHGELGLGDIVKEATTPRIISTISEIQQVLCGWQHSVFHSLNGQVLACGNNRHGQLGIHHGTDIPTIKSLHHPSCVYLTSSARSSPLIAKQVVVGWHHVLCLTPDGAVMSWGKGDHGQLGQGIFHSNSAPAQVQIPVSDDEKVIQIACGSEHGLVLTDSYKLYTFGWGEHGNLGHGDTYNSAIPQLVEFFQENQLKVVHITAGGAVSYAVVTR